MGSKQVTLKIPHTVGNMPIISFVSVATHVVDSSTKMNASQSGARQQGRIANALFGKEPGDEVTMLREDVEALASEMDSPAKGYHLQLFQMVDESGNKLAEPVPVPMPVRVFVPYFDAIAEALEPAAKSDEKAA